ncbi:class II aldolase/adducin family protein [Bradyrhizobium stylosanthis]|uniref:L-fuculose-phosphate aldolase n=1 Tax=Bradyrhizobium stylosanthis TaxID=1803665 RepID=A0A560CZ30_9BRAD|nr:class II aldolase/adducin family protein [Bradyrhizobium stylosanthis]TWA90118.1 L-fuculose-phosphate aldolase [Bradyrhizobium stylosanthis]
MTERELRHSVLDVVARLETMGFNHGSSGNVSCRMGEDILITPTGGNSGNTTPDRLVRLKRDGTLVGDGLPSSEWHMHLAILNAYPHVNAIVHTHADCCVALSCLAKPIPAFHYMIASFGGNDVPCAPYATFGTRALADGAVAALEKRKACLLANHGMIAAGKGLQAAFELTVKLETLARQYLLACQAGAPAILPDDEMARVLERYGSYGRAALPA